MTDPNAIFAHAFAQAFALITAWDAELMAIVGLSLQVTLSAVAIACVIAIPLGALLAVSRFPGRWMVDVFVNAMMGLPPVVIGLTLYLLFSAIGPFGVLDLLYTPTLMIIAQIILVAPIIAALSRQVIGDLYSEYRETLMSMGASRWQTMVTLIIDARFSLLTAAVAGLGRALAEVGAVMIVGGNINHLTRVMTTSIALETARGAFAMALALGIILLSLTIAINGCLMAIRSLSSRYADA